MTDLTTGSAPLAGTPSDVSVSTPTETTAIDNNAVVNTGLDPHIAALQQPLSSVNKDAWYNKIENADLKGYAELRNWQSPEAVVESYQNLEKLMGADKAGRGMVLPADEADTEGWNKVFERLGKPAKAEDYKLDIPEGFDGNMTKEAANWMHELGLNTKQAQALNGKYNEYLTQTMQAADAKYQQEQKQQVDQIMQEWGNNADKNIELTRRGIRAAGLDENTLAQMDRAIGAKKVYEIFQKIGASYLEDKFEANGGQTNPFGMSPEAARVEIQGLMKDKDFGAKLLAGDSIARQRWDNLNAVAVKR